ncbi:hypothetical protein KV557_16475 [Kitasatospora aureofaciens]|uniref:hypothetical protein n=1 Tax=Kitasatospora aureofaciens TaxID=1894 RepID=UPI001C440216|nr:hypothetical protein [Kitasatospora aureofaciens]MBV6698700.1 hypothetical protein [Kitasatospora aureofaciens]
MRPGTASFLIATAFALLLALAIATVALGVLTALKMPSRDDQAALPPLPPRQSGRQEPEHHGPAQGITT